MYSGKVRVRVCGLLIENQKLLLLKHDGLGMDGFIWSPPGGGIDFSETAEEAIVREFHEETGLQVRVDEFLFVNEFRTEKLHAVELFFKVHRESGELKLGADPELPKQILTEIAFLSIEQLNSIGPNHLHNIFSEIEELNDLLKLSGYYKFDQFKK